MTSKVLLVEDDADACDAIAIALRRRGIDVLSTDEGRKALELMRTWRPAAVLLDLHMEGMDGVAFWSAKRQDAQLARIPVLVMTGDPRPAIRGDLLLAKPFSIEELVAKLSRFVPELAPRPHRPLSA